MKTWNFLHVLRRKGGVVNTVVVVATAEAFVVWSKNEHLKCINLDTSYGLGLGFTKRAGYSRIGKKRSEANISTSNRWSCGTLFYSIALSLTMNFDQTSLKYAPVTNQTLSKKGLKHVALKRLSFWQSITCNSGINFAINTAHLWW